MGKFKSITLEDIRQVFFPKNFHEKYRYLGSVPWKDEGDIFMAMKPLVLLMDLEARPWWCPRWFLRFLHLYGNDNSIVRVRNRRLSNLKIKLTKGLLIWLRKTKWYPYDLRISISGQKYLQDLADSIEESFYRRGRKEELIEILSGVDSITKEHNLKHLSYCELINLYDKCQQD